MKEFLLSKRAKKINNAPGGLENLVLILKKAQEKAKKGIKLINCSLGETSFNLLPSIKKVGKGAIERNEGSYTKPFFGLPSLRNALSSSFKKEGIKVLPENIIVTAGSETGLDLFFRAILDSGDEVIIFDPFFPPFVICALAYGGKPIFIDTFRTQFNPDPTIVKKKVSKKTKVIVVNSPNNPTGAVYPLKTLKEIIKIARKFNLIILSDEVYADFIYEGKFISFAKLYPEGAVILRSFSKKYCMMGYKVGYMIGPPKLTKRIQSIFLPMHSGPRISEIMATEATKHPLSKKVINNFKGRRDFIYKSLKNYYPDLVKPKGAFYFYIKAPKKDALKFSLNVLEKGLLVSPAFSRRKTHFRISYAGLKKKNLKKFVGLLKEASLFYNK